MLGKRLGIVAVLGFALIALSGCGRNSPAVTTGPTPAAVEPGSADSTKPSGTLTARQFWEEYRKDSKGAEKKYQGKEVVMQGVVSRFGRSPTGQSYIILKAGDDPLGVWCYTADEEPWGHVSPGQTVKIRGKWPEVAFTATLAECVVLEAGANPAVVVSAQQLAREFKANREAAQKKYQNKYLIVEGEVAEKRGSEVGALSLLLKGEENVRVECRVTAAETGLPDAVQVGQRVKVIGEFDVHESENAPVLLQCRPIKQSP